MNGTQQRQHKTRTDELRHVLRDTQGAVVERFEEVEASFAAMHDTVTELRQMVHAQDQKWADQFQSDLAFACTSMHKTIDDVRREGHIFGDRFHAFIGRGFWGRLNWLFTGR